MERETKELIAGKHKLEVLTYVSVREGRGLYTKYVDSVGGDETKIDSSSSTKLQDEQIKLIVKSVNGSSENVLDSILDMDIKSFTVITDYIGEMMGEKKSTQK